MKERRHTIAWHPQHAALYKSYHSKISCAKDHQATLSLFPFSLFYIRPIWNHLAEWRPIVDGPKPQGSNFALNHRQDLIQPVITNVVNETQHQIRSVEAQPEMPTETHTSHSDLLPLIVNHWDTCISTADLYDGEQFSVVNEQHRLIPVVARKQLSPLSLFLHHNRTEVADPIYDAHLQVAVVLDTQAELTSLWPDGT